MCMSIRNTQEHIRNTLGTHLTRHTMEKTKKERLIMSRAFQKSRKYFKGSPSVMPLIISFNSVPTYLLSLLFICYLGSMPLIISSSPSPHLFLSIFGYCYYTVYTQKKSFQVSQLFLLIFCCCCYSISMPLMIQFISPQSRRQKVKKRERERQRERMCVCVYIYMYIYMRERDRERERERER